MDHATLQKVGFEYNYIIIMMKEEALFVHCTSSLSKTKSIAIWNYKAFRRLDCVAESTKQIDCYVSKWSIKIRRNLKEKNFYNNWSLYMWKRGMGLQWLTNGRARNKWKMIIDYTPILFIKSNRKFSTTKVAAGCPGSCPWLMNLIGPNGGNTAISQRTELKEKQYLNRDVQGNK